MIEMRASAIPRDNPTQALPSARSGFRVTRRRAGEYAVRADKSGFPLLEIERSQESGQWFVAGGAGSRLAGEFACVTWPTLADASRDCLQFLQNEVDRAREFLSRVEGMPLDASV